MSQSQRDRWAQYGAPDEAIVAAVAEQRGFVLHMLGSRRWEAEDVLAQVALDMVASMPRWVAVPQRPRPSLGSWARGVAVRTFYVWVRSPGAGHGPGGMPLVSAEALAEQGVTLPATAPEPVREDETRTARRAIVRAVRQLVMAQPGGAADWHAMVTPEGHVRGKSARATLGLLLEVADPTGNLRRRAGLLVRGPAGDAGASHAA